jgi:regulatory protein YycH of two-component signal transduction system YycFG
MWKYLLVNEYKGKLISLVLWVKSKESFWNTTNTKLNRVYCFYNSLRVRVQKQILFDIWKTTNIPGTLLQAILGTYTQSKILIKFKSKLSKLAYINKGLC